jgi:hypothetical protein
MDAERPEGVDRGEHCAGAGPPVLVVIRGVYDGGLFYECARCGFAFDRWPKGHYLNGKARRYIVMHNERRAVAQLDSHPRTVAGTEGGRGGNEP